MTHAGPNHGSSTRSDPPASEHKVGSGALPTFSVIIPTFNRPQPLANCLRAVSRLNYPGERFEVIVVDDGSAASADPANVVRQFHADRLDLRLLRQPNAGPAAARNKGVAAARCECVAFTDDDCEPHPDWLLRLGEALRREPDALVGGQCRNALPSRLCATASHTIIEVVHAHFNRDPARAFFFPSDNMAASRQRLMEIGGFDPAFRWSEDRDLCDRWSARGWPLVIALDALVDHAHVMGLGGFVRQHFGYGRGAWRFHRARARRRSGRLEVAGGFYAKCFAAPWSQPRWHRAAALTMLMGVWQLANTAGFAFEALRSPFGAHGRRAEACERFGFTSEEAAADA